MDLYERMRTGKLYYCNDEKMMADQAQCLEKLYDFNHTRPLEMEKRAELLKGLLGQVGKNCYIEPPLHANWGCNTYFGDDVYANFNLTLVDDGDIFVGNNVMFGPNVVVTTAGHPVRPDIRKKTAQFNLPIHIGENVWIGSGVTILPGVTIGENSVIGAGSVVTRDIPANVVAVGNPCRILREINENDWKYYRKDMEIDIE